MPGALRSRVILVNLRSGEPFTADLITRETSAARLTSAERIHRACGDDGDRTACKEPEFHDVQPENGMRSLPPGSARTIPMARAQLAPVSIEFKLLRSRFVSFYCGKNYKSAGLIFEFSVSSSQLPVSSFQLPASKSVSSFQFPVSTQPCSNFYWARFQSPVSRLQFVSPSKSSPAELVCNSAKCPNRGARLAPDHFRAANVGSREGNMGNPGMTDGRLATRDSLLTVSEMLNSGECEPAKAAVHGLLMATVALCAAYNTAAWIKRRQTHLAINAIVYSAAIWWERCHVVHHLRACPDSTSTAPRPKLMDAA